MTELELKFVNGGGGDWGDQRHTGEVRELWEVADRVVTFLSHMSGVTVTHT